MLQWWNQMSNTNHSHHHKLRNHRTSLSGCSAAGTGPRAGHTWLLTGFLGSGSSTRKATGRTGSARYWWCSACSGLQGRQRSSRRWRSSECPSHKLEEGSHLFLFTGVSSVPQAGMVGSMLRALHWYPWKVSGNTNKIWTPAVWSLIHRTALQCVNYCPHFTEKGNRLVENK